MFDKMPHQTVNFIDIIGINASLPSCAGYTVRKGLNFAFLLSLCGMKLTAFSSRSPPNMPSTITKSQKLELDIMDLDRFV